LKVESKRYIKFKKSLGLHLSK
jgi:peptidyl-prolyl cis-trans isomerase-like protein 2